MEKKRGLGWEGFLEEVLFKLIWDDGFVRLIDIFGV